MTRAAEDEAKQALWRDKEIARRLAREQEDALERVLLRNETLALYEEVRRRHAKEDELERLGLRVDKSDEEPASADAGQQAEDKSLAEPVSVGMEPKVDMIKFEETADDPLHVGWGSHFLSDDDKDTDQVGVGWGSHYLSDDENSKPFDKSKNKKK